MSVRIQTRVLCAAVFASVVLAPLAQGAETAKPASTPAIDQRHTWDLSDLYPSVEAWDAERKRLLAELPKLEALKGKLGKDAAALRTGLDAISAVRREGFRVSVYSGLAADVDQRVSTNIERNELAKKLLNDLGSATSWLSNDILAIGAAKVEKFIAADQGLAKHAFFLRDTVRGAAHTLSPEGESIMAAVDTLRQDPESIYELISNANIPWPTVKLADGTQAKLTQAGYTKFRHAANRADRKLVFDAFWKTHKDYQDSIGASLFAEVKGNAFNAKTRKHASALNESLYGDNLPEGVYRTLVAETNAAVPVLHRYLALRKKLLGVKDELRYYDIYPPMFSLKKVFNIDDSKAITLAAVKPLGQEYTTKLKEALSARWMSVYPGEGKRSGAYMNGSAYAVHPYLLLNHNDDYEGLTTFVHEWGHGMHSVLANKAQPFETANYSTFTAEIASISNEFLLIDHMVGNAAGKDEKLYYLGQTLETIRATMFRQVMFAEFELAIHEAVEKGEALTGEKLTQMYCGLLKRYHGHDAGVMKIDDAYCTEWAYIPHFYYNFYVFQYSTSMVAASYFADEVGKGDAQRENYLNVLRAGGSAYPYDILKKAGLDMASPAPYRALYARMDKIIGQIEQQRAERKK